MSEWVKLLSHVWLFATPWTVAHQAPASMGFSRQEYWSGLPFPSPGDLPDLGIEPRSPALRADALPSEPPGNLVYDKRIIWLKAHLDKEQSKTFGEASQRWKTFCERENRLGVSRSRCLWSVLSFFLLFSAEFSCRNFSVVWKMQHWKWQLSGIALYPWTHEARNRAFLYLKIFLFPALIFRWFLGLSDPPAAPSPGWRKLWGPYQALKPWAELLIICPHVLAQPTPGLLPPSSYSWSDSDPVTIPFQGHGTLPPTCSVAKTLALSKAHSLKKSFQAPRLSLLLLHSSRALMSCPDFTGHVTESHPQAVCPLKQSRR